MTPEQARAYGITDAHAHIFPAKIAEKATGSVGAFYGIGMRHTGTAEALLEAAGQAGISRCLVCSTATKPGQAASINSFIAAVCTAHPALFGLGTVFPGEAGAEGELERIAALELHGVKLHPDFQQFDIDDARLFPLYRRCAALGLPILFHTGDDRYDFSAPRRLARVLERVDGLRAIAAHFGGYQRWDEAAQTLAGFPGLRFDTSSSLSLLPEERALSLLDRLGPERFFFGTDFPMWTPRQEVERLLALPLPDGILRGILHRNFAQFFGLED